MPSEIHRIDIPAARPRGIEYQAADILIDRLRHLGADPWKIAKNTMGVAIAKAWAGGEMGDAQFDRSIRNLMILNPALKAT